MPYDDTQKKRRQIINVLICFLVLIIVVTSTTSIFQNNVATVEKNEAPIETGIASNEVSTNVQADFLLAQFNNSLDEYKSALTKAEENRDALAVELKTVKQQLVALQEEMNKNSSTVENSPSSNSTVNETVAPTSAQGPTDSKRTHTVVAGDTLTSISKLYYGTPKFAQKIYDANKEIVPNKNRIKPGIQLVIP